MINIQDIEFKYRGSDFIDSLHLLRSIFGSVDLDGNEQVSPPDTDHIAECRVSVAMSCWVVVGEVFPSAVLHRDSGVFARGLKSDLDLC